MRYRIGTLMLLIVTLSLAAALVVQNRHAAKSEAQLQAQLQAVIQENRLLERRIIVTEALLQKQKGP